MSITIVERLLAHAQARPHATAFRFLDDLAHAPQELDYAALLRQAQAVAAFLLSKGQAGERVMLFFPPGLAYVQAFYGCLLAGMVAVPLYPPRRNVKSDRVMNVAQSCSARLALTTASELPAVQAAWDEQNTMELPLSLFAVEAAGQHAGAAAGLPLPAPDAPAFLQYTSGSTGTPKGVIVTHANIVANGMHLTSMSATGSEGVFVNWVPAFHDLGLVTGILVPVLLGATSVLMAPASFVRTPALWLQAISRYRGNRCGAPNFAFDLCVDKIEDHEMEGVDLSCWEVAYNAAEPVRAETLERFASRFARWGFKPQAMFPSYGMAEATLAISGGPMHEEPLVLTVDREALSGLRLAEADAAHPAATRVVGCGSCPAPHAVRVVDPESGAVLPDGQVGEIWFSGPSVSPGYWGLPELSEQTFGNHVADREDERRYLRTGDLGVQSAGQLFIVGRIKDVIILRGRNYYPQDIEAAAAAAHPAVKRGCVAAFTEDEAGGERLVVVAELEREHFRKTDTEQVSGAIRQAIARQFEITVDRVVLLRPYKIPMTSSGKIQRRQTRAMLADGSLETLAQSAAGNGALLAPRTPTEQALAACWSKVLGRPAVGVDQNFFEIGGDSLAAVELASLLARSHPALPFDPSQLFELPTIAALAAWIDQAQADAACQPQRLERGASYTCPASLAQQRMLFMEEMAGAASYYNIPLAYRIEGELDREALERAFGRLLAAHDILRTTYENGADGVIQRVHAPSPFTLGCCDLAAEADPQAALAQALASDADHRFDLATEWPLRARLLRLNGGSHVLSLNVHHIAADGHSARQILAELGQHYAACRHGSEAGAPRAWQYADYCDWQSRWQDSDGHRAAQEYWTTAMAHAPALHSILTDKPRPAIQSVQGAHWKQALSAELVQRLGAQARAQGATPFVLYQAVFAALLARYGGETDIVFGTAAANRYPAQFAATAGLFVNTLPLRFTVEDDASFAQLLAQARQLNASALRHQHYPFDSLVERLAPARSPAHLPLVQLMLVMQDEDGQALALEGTHVTPLDQVQAVSKFELALHVRSRAGEVTLDWEYASALFGAATVGRISQHFVRLLEACVADPQQCVGAVALDDAPASASADLAGAAGQAVCVHRLFETHALRRPDAIAVREGDSCLSYAELDAQAEHLARHLAQAGAGAATPVAVCMEKSTGLIAAMLAIYKVGATYVPLDPHYPAQRLAFMLSDVDAPLLLAAAPGGLADQLETAGRRLYLDQLLSTAAESPYPPCAAPELGAYIIYTSGSTGQPKGVRVTHANLYYSLHANGAMAAIGPDDSMPTIGSQAFGASLLEIMLPLANGGSVRITTKAQVVDVEALVRASADVTVLHAVPSLMRQWLDVVRSAGPQAYPKLRLLLCGGEAVPAGLLASIRQWRPAVRVLGFYGMTEAAIVCSAHDASEPSGAMYSIGKPYPHATFHVMDRQGRPQPEGVPGELYIGGLSVAEGYIGQPALTAERFLSLPAGRLYRTGDRVRRLPNGHYEFLGRVDHQVSLRGARIEMGEIETLALPVPGVKQAIAHVVGEPPMLVLYYSSDLEGSARDAVGGAIRAQLSERLPDYMRPSVIACLDTFPLNPNGKVDRKRLPVPQAQDEMAEAATPLEARVLAIAHELLQRSDFGVTANFFEIGGHSLMAARLVSRLRAEFGVDFPLATLYASPSVRACAQAIDEGLRNKYAASLAIADGASADNSDELIL